MIRKRYTVADFFSGCGGLSHGFLQTGRYQVLLGSDIKSEALETFVRNHVGDHGEPEAILEDIRTVKPADILKRLAKHGVSAVGELDCLIGGPPCEGFSQNRSINAGGHVRNGSASRVDRFIDDPRNDLFRWFLELADFLKPAVILIENVPDLVRHKDGETLKEILGALDRIGYVGAVRVLNAADYGVPQMRRRAIFLAQRKADLAITGLKPSFPALSHIPFPLHYRTLDDDKSWMPGDSGYWPSVQEAIGDLPEPSPGADGRVVADYGRSSDSRLRRLLRTSDEYVFNHQLRPLGKSGLEKVQALTSGQAASDLPDHLRPKSSFHYSYSRLRWSEPARTITKFCYHVGSGMFAHPVEDRGLTMREAARLQTFPDNFRFHSTNIRELSAMIGSAVPPLLARTLAQSVVRYLDDLQSMTIPSSDRSNIRRQATDAVMKRLHGEEWSSDSANASPLLL